MKSIKIGIKILLGFLISLIGVLLLLFILMNLSFSKNFFTRQINLVFEKTDLPIRINSVRRILPTSIRVQGVVMHSQNADTIVFADEVSAAFSPMAFFKRKVILHSVILSGSKVKLARNNEAGKLNIAEAFSRPQKKPPPDPVSPSKPWDVIIEKAEFSETSFMMHDSVAGIHIIQSIRKLIVKTDEMSLAGKTILIKSLEINVVSGFIRVEKSPGKETIGESTPWKIGLTALTLNDINLIFNETSEKLLMEVILGNADIKTNNIDITNKLIDFNKIALSKTSIILRRNSQKYVSDVSNTDNSFNFPWNIKGEKIELQEVSFSMYDNQDPVNITSSPAFGISGLDITLSDIQLDSINAALAIKNLKFGLTNGFSMMSMKGRIESHPGKTEIDLSVETTNSQINIEGNANAGISDIISKPEKTGTVSAIIKNTRISFQDLYCFKNHLKEDHLIQSLSQIPVKIDANISLVDSVVTIAGISVNQPGKIGIKLDGKAYNIFHRDKTTGNIRFTISDINSAILKETLKASGIQIKIPDFNEISINGTLTDSLKSPGFTFNLLSDLGNIGLTGSVDIENDRFTVNSVFNRLLLNKILNNSILGSFSGSVHSSGTGIIKKNLDAEALLLIDSLHFKDYIYTNAKVDFKLLPSQYAVNLLVDDPALVCDFKSIVNTTDSILAVTADGTFNAKLNELHMFGDTLDVEGKISSNLKKKGGELESSINVSDIKLTTPGDIAKIKEITASLISDSLKTIFSGKADFFNAYGHINTPLKDLGSLTKVFSDYIRSFIDLPPKGAAARTSLFPDITATMNISSHKAIEMIVRDTTLHFENIELSAVNSSSKGILNYKILTSSIGYKGIEFGNLNSIITDSAGTMNVNFSAERCSFLSYPVNKLVLTSRFDNGKGLSRFSVLDKQDEPEYDFEFSLATDSDNLIIKVPSKQLTLNKVNWLLDSPDIISISRKKKTFAPNLRMHTTNSFLNFGISDNTYICELGTMPLSSIFPTDLIQGNPSAILSGSVNIGTDISKRKEIKGDVQLDDVQWSDLKFKNVSMNTTFISDSSGNSDLDLAVKLDSSELNLKGNIKSGKDKTFAVDFNQIHLATIEPFVKKFLSDLKGNISGDIKISTKDAVNNITGEVDIENVSLRINTLSSTYRIPHDKILFEGKKMVFDNFRTIDSLGNELLVAGNLDFSKKASVISDIEITSSNLQILNRKEEKNSSFWGDIFIDTKLSVRGAVSSPVLKGKIVLARGTDIYFRQSENLNLSESGNVLTFTRGKSLEGQAGQKIEPGSSLYNKSSVESVIEIDPATRINIDISKKMFNIDMVIQGGGELNYNMLVNSQVNMNGRYEISEGGANLKMVGWPNKAFRLTRGGSIRWDGKLDDPDLKLEAINRVKSSYVNPVDNKERYVDFDVTLKISDRLSVMDVSFTIYTSDQYLMSIINTLSPQEQMRQAITILLFETVDLPGISTSSSYMSEQVNQMVAAQLNSLTKTTIKGIDISFGIDTYTQGTSSGGEQTKTSLSYDVKRNLLNDRAKVEFSGIASGTSNQSQSSNTSLNNFSFEYRIDSASTKFLKVYNEHTYEDVFEGDVVKTGIGFTYRKSYPSLGDIWRKKEKIVQPNNPDK